MPVVIFSLVYRLARRLFELLVLRTRSDASKDVARASNHTAQKHRTTSGTPQATDPEIVIQRRAQRGHATPPGDGHGRASTRSAVWSTLAYIAVVFCSRWRST